MMGITVERVESDHAIDVAAIDALGREAFHDPDFSIHGEITRPWGRVWMARSPDSGEGDSPLGFLVGWHVADELHILNIATMPAARRRGVARALMEESLRYAAEHHIRIMLLEVRRSNRAAIKLYRGFGFTALGVRSRYYDDDEDAIEMILALDPGSGAILPGRDEIRIDD